MSNFKGAGEAAGRRGRREERGRERDGGTAETGSPGTAESADRQRRTAADGGRRRRRRSPAAPTDEKCRTRLFYNRAIMGTRERTETRQPELGRQCKR